MKKFLRPLHPLPFFKKACNSYQNKVIMMKKSGFGKGKLVKNKFQLGGREMTIQSWHL